MESELMKDILKKKVKEIPGEWVTIKEIAGIIGFSAAKVYKDYHAGNMKGVIRSGNGDQNNLIIPKNIALKYIDFIF